jgi:hypothetical protein
MNGQRYGRLGRQPQRSQILMSMETHSTRDDLAFMRALVAEGANDYSMFGQLYRLAGLVFGGQVVLQAGQIYGWFPAGGLWSLGVGVAPTLLFLASLAVIVWRRRRDKRPSPTGRAVNAAFGSIGMGNLALLAVFGVVAWRENSIFPLLIFPCAVFVLQAAAWLFAWTIRRRAWLGLVAAGWCVAGISMAANIHSVPGYLFSAGLGLLLCMAIPGWTLVRSSRRAA